MIDTSHTIQSFNPTAGTCGNCGSPAINAFEYICTDCCLDVGLSTFPEYTYPSELTINNSGAVYHHFMYYGDH